ncbi:uncharacterized protein VDAG_09598 [Verticillium dahliae VdLs.17]|uniref:AAA+ ATPase domain-containing protein n=1 Tax=Verticillium dahliae (strain VdLs.17 / ATCC MYA-4575 / FGSC 10137) TaxID=498257 RepID=G2XHU8_VERDV|nr:uncharacterized protein VDAG_09598 [Verticillium dahliae VdLs.17]EGY19396.1 hypothetical protein VDAG_09598 [Verticillium dahliae VdLs.17]
MAPEAFADPKKLHPFFTPGSDRPTPSDALTSEHPTAEVGSLPRADHDGPTPKRRKIDPDALEEANTPSTKKRRNPRKQATNGPSIIEALSKSSSLGTNEPDTPSISTGPATPLAATERPLSNVPVPNTSAANAEQSQPLQDDAKPKRVLKFNPKTGTIGSPPKPKTTTPTGAKSKTAKGKQASFIVTIPFGQDPESRQRIGSKIEEILRTPSTAIPDTKTPPKKGRGKSTKPAAEKAKQTKMDPQTGQPVTTTAPPAAKAAAPPPPRQVIFSSTPCSPKKPRNAIKRTNLPQFGVKSMGLRVPGAAHPAWAAKGATHVTGLAEDCWSQTEVQLPPGISSRKAKGRVTNVPPQESVVGQLGAALDIKGIIAALSAQTEEFDTPPPELRLPGKHFESGPKLQARIRPELRTPLPSRSSLNDDSDDEIVTTTRQAPHAAVSRLYKSLATSLSAFDRSECEDLAWVQKYAPATAAEVLQVGRDAIWLRDWLEMLKVQSVDTGITTDQKPATVKAVSGPKKKRKRGKLDGFVVSSDEDASYDPDDMTEPEDENVPLAPKQTIMQTIPKSGKDMPRVANAALISGPHGSGKTAAVYAIAKELGFEVFEINSSSRRSGKDVLDKVGDMTRNHLVQRHQDSKQGDAEDPTAKDVKSGKQGTVMSFFKPKPAQISTPASTTIPPPAVPVPAQVAAPSGDKQEEAEKSKNTQPKSQKQSLILIEEADVLYEEDKQFWTTMTTLIAQSKRPFIMTCNDESLIPIQTLNLHGIFRLSPPPTELALDVMLLIAANEGHALRRPAVQALLESRGGDIRASLTELNYWCQLGVGDRRGGFEWFYPRWPRGCDKDKNGHVVRVVSQGTYLEGMGFAGAESLGPSQREEDELLLQSWDSLGMDLSNWHETRDQAAWAGRMASASRSERLAALDIYERFADTMSAADLCSNGRFGVGLQENLDATQPDITAKAREDYTLGRRLLEAPLVTDHEPFCTSAAISLRCGARQLADDRRETYNAPMGCIKPSDVIKKLCESAPAEEDMPIVRYDMALAFDPIAISERHSIVPASFLDPSVFDRTMRLITLDVAPFVRGIVAYDRRMAGTQRSSLLSENVRPGKRLRQTRMAALDGGAMLRREHYFGSKLNPYFVMRTGGKGWAEAAVEEAQGDGIEEETQAQGDGIEEETQVPPVAVESSFEWANPVTPAMFAMTAGRG